MTIVRRAETLKYYLENYQSSNNGLSNLGDYMSLKHIIVMIIFQVLSTLFEYHKSHIIVLYFIVIRGEKIMNNHETATVSKHFI